MIARESSCPGTKLKIKQQSMKQLSDLIIASDSKFFSSFTCLIGVNAM